MNFVKCIFAGKGYKFAVNQKKFDKYKTGEINYSATSQFKIAVYYIECTE